MLIPELTVEDLAMLCENDNQEYIFQAGHVATQGHWRFREKLGCTLHEIHVNGPVEVPGWRDVLRKSMERYFLKMTPEKAVQRTNVRATARCVLTGPVYVPER